MTKRDEEILASIGMTMEEVDVIADACEAGDCSAWDNSKAQMMSEIEEYEDMPSEIDFSNSRPNPFAGKVRKKIARN